MPLSSFYIKANGRPMSVCKKCNASRKAEWRRLNPDKERAMRKRDMERNGPLRREQNRQSRDRHVESRRRRNREYYHANAETMKQQSREWHLNNPEASSLLHKKWRERNRDDLSERARLSRYGVAGYERGDYELMLANQGGKCAICGHESSRLCVDHCHSNNRIRSLLCVRCNAGLGNFRDDPGFMRKAADYIERHERAFKDDPTINDLPGYTIGQETSRPA